MGFNYLQTDDRDDYFDQLRKKKKVKEYIVVSFSLINPKGEEILTEVRYHYLRSYFKRTYLPMGVSGKHIWKKELVKRGYKVVDNYEKNPNWKEGN